MTLAEEMRLVAEKNISSTIVNKCVEEHIAAIRRAASNGKTEIEHWIHDTSLPNEGWNQVRDKLREQGFQANFVRDIYGKELHYALVIKW